MTPTETPGFITDLFEKMREHMPRFLPILKTVEESWQPHDFLPDSSKETWFEDVRRLREESKALTDEVLVVLVGNTVTEEALPSYQTWLNRFDAVRDDTGDSEEPWAKWTRGWTAEENRHGDLMNRYLYLTGRVDMRSVERTVHYLLARGFNPQTGNHPYKGIIYTSFQERATRISHSNTAQLAKRDGDMTLHKICTAIAADEARHEKGYKDMMAELFHIDPANSVTAFAQMMRHQIVMPAKHMEDATAPDLFNRFAMVAQRIGVYTAHDYADIFEHLMEHWKIASLTGLSGEAAASQDYLSEQAERYRKMADRLRERLARSKDSKTFPWIFDRSV